MYIMSAEYVSIRESVLGKLERNLPEIQRRFGVDTLGIFGSVSRGEDTAESDVDVLYRFDEEHGRLSDIVGLHDYLVQLFGRELDLVSVEYVSPLIREAVSADAMLYGAVRSLA